MSGDVGSATTRGLAELICGRNVVVCVGPGGVGKTTTSAALGLEAALRGRRALVLTVDPARRLADSLGLEGLLPEPAQVDISSLASRADSTAKGELWAMMLDTQHTFDAVIERHAPSAEVAQRVTEHPFYGQLSSALAGSQEYMAMEKLYELQSEGRYDLLVLDTPPTAHALDFLDAPKRMQDFFDNPTLQLLVSTGKHAGRLGFHLFRANALVLKGIGRFIGTDVFSRILDFVEALSAMSQGFADRARRVDALLRQPDVAFLVVSGPERASVDEGLYFLDRLKKEGMPLGSFLVNRVRHSFGLSQESANLAESLREGLHSALQSALVTQTVSGQDEQAGAPALPVLNEAEIEILIERLIRTAMGYETMARADRALLEELRARLAPCVPVVDVPYFSRDVHDVHSLAAFAQHVTQSLSFTD